MDAENMQLNEAPETMIEEIEESAANTTDATPAAEFPATDTTAATDATPAKIEKVKEASKSAKRKLYKKEPVYRIDKDDREYDEEVESKKATFIELVASAKSRRILTGMVVGCRENALGIIAEIEYNAATVLIPASELIEFPEEVTKMDAPAKNTWAKKQINQRLGSEVDFIVMQVDEKLRLAVGSRIDAMLTKAHDHYSKNLDGIARINEGELAEGRIVCVYSVGMIVEVFGVDIPIRQDEIDWNRLSEVDKDYNVGDRVRVRIMNVTPSTIIRKVNVNGEFRERKLPKYIVEASVKRVKEDPHKLYYDEFEIKGNYLGVVTQVTSKGIFVLMKGKMDAICGLPEEGQIPTVGSRVMVTVTRKEDKERLIYATLKRVIKLA